jgi:MerR HTH family regulatory protein
MDQNLTIQQLAAATSLNRTQIDQWISRGHFRPKHSPEIGRARAFTIDDAVVLGALAELVRIGMPPAVASMHVHHVYGFSDDDALLVVTQGTIDTGKNGVKVYDPDSPATHSEVIRAKQLIKFATDPNVRSMSIVNLSEVEKRVLKSIGST